MSEMTKKCHKCGKSKELEQFHKSKANPDGLVFNCKECVSNYHKLEYYPNNKEKINANSKEWKEKNPDYFINWNLKNKDKMDEYDKKYQKEWYSIEENRIKHIEYMNLRYSKKENKEKARLYNQNNKEKKNKQRKEKYANNIHFRISSTIKTRVWFALKGIKKYKNTESLLGCTIILYKLYLESLFLPEMNWLNWGTVWEIDHIEPCASFDLTKSENQFKCFNYKNTMPRFSTTLIAESFGYKNYIGNREKGDKILN